MQERDISRQLALREYGACEVRTPAGFIDVLTPTVVYEVKEVTGWKSAIGQLLSYARYYPKHTPKLYLYGECTRSQRLLIQEHCKALNIKVVWHREQPAITIPDPSNAEPIVRPDGLSLKLLVIDHAESLKATCNVHLALPTEDIPDEVLNSHVDEALAAFDALLDNELVVTLSYRRAGEMKTFERTRPNIAGVSAYQRLIMSLQTNSRIRFTTSIPGARGSLPSGNTMVSKIVYGGRTPFPELQRLFVFSTHPQFPWINKLGMPAVAVESVCRKKVVR